MNSTKDLLHQILNPELSTDERARLRCRLAKQLEEAGNYEAAREAMGELWLGVGELPNLEGLDPRLAAEVLLRAGVLTGWIGSTWQIKGAQETAKNLISESIAIFESLLDVKKVAEAQTEIAICYEREGGLDEARVMFAEALDRLDDQDGDLKAIALLRSAALEKIANRLNDALSILTTTAPLVEASTNHTLKGRFHNELATVLKNLGATEVRPDYIDRALIEYAAASFHFEQAGHARYQACVENNLAMLFLKADKFAEAHEHLDCAQALFTRLDDMVHLAQVEETRARVMLAEGLVAKAEKIALSAVRMLQKGGEQSLLAEALTTHGVALARLHKEEEARTAFESAINIAEQAGDLESAGRAALTLVEQLAEQLSNDELCEVLGRARLLLKNTQDTAIRTRLTECAYRGLSLVHVSRPDWATFSLEQTLHRHEARFIKMALEDAGGVISRAAQLLGLPGHQSLRYMLNSRHKSLREAMRPITAREDETTLDDETIRGLDKEASEKRQRVKILHVEDNRVVADAVKETLELESWEVETCADGAAALKKILGPTRYDLLLLDYDLPGVSGIELVRQSRSVAHRQNTPIIVLSAALGEAEAREAGANKFLHKPEDISSLVETISGLLSSAEDEET